MQTNLANGINDSCFSSEAELYFFKLNLKSMVYKLTIVSTIYLILFKWIKEHQKVKLILILPK